jgi:hypothetical protein
VDVEPDTNSEEWWNRYFRSSWDEYDGSRQTRHFMRQLLLHLPGREAAFLREASVAVLDWGCAFGEGVDVLGRALRGAAVDGADFSGEAVEVAARRFPTHAFHHVAGDELPGDYDVIVTSNTLEHLTEPLAAVQRHLRSTRLVYAALTPFDEEPLRPEHFARLSLDTYPEELDGFTRVHCAPFPVDQAFWPGEQLLVVYASRDYLDRPEPDPRHAAELRLEQERALLEDRAGDLEARLEASHLREWTLSERAREAEEARAAATEERRQALEAAEAAERDAQDARAARDAAESRAQELGADLARLGEQATTDQAEIARLQEWVDTIHASRSWRLTAPLRRLRGHG